MRPGASVSLLLIWVLGQFGLAYIVGHSAISLPFRQALAPEEVKTVGHAFRQFIITLLECPACLGFWAGAVSIWLVSMVVVLPVPLYVAAPAAAVVTCGANYIVARLTSLVPPAVSVGLLNEQERSEILHFCSLGDELHRQMETLNQKLRPTITDPPPTSF